MTAINIKRLDPDNIAEFTSLIQLFGDVFEMENFSIPETASLQKTLNKPEFIAYVAMQNGNVIGGLTAYVLAPYCSTVPEVYIYDLAVDTNYQRKGIGKQLIDAIKDDCRSNGMKEVFVQADMADQYAVDFYRSTGGKELRVAHFSYSL